LDSVERIWEFEAVFAVALWAWGGDEPAYGAPNLGWIQE